ncbi:MAG: methionyl-tRNA formyltransferase [Victivallaceae bacterium]
MDENNQIKLYFMGSGEIAVPVLAAISASSRINLLGIATQPDQPAGRRCMLRETPVARFAPATGLTPDKPERVDDPGFMAYLAGLQPDVILVVSFGQILRHELLELPKFGCMNIHSSLLPRYRGASPISTAILNRDQVTGVTFMRMDEGLDAGGIYSSYRYPLTGNEYVDELEKALGNFAANYVVEVLVRLTSGKLKAVPQNQNEVTLTRKIKKQYGAVDWSMTAEELEAKIRAFTPWPGVFFSARRNERVTTIKITAARILGESIGKPGEILQADRKGLIIACGSGALELIRLVPQGRKEMGSTDFLNGFRLNVGDFVYNGA